MSLWPKLSIRLKLTAGFVVTVLLANAILALITAFYVGHLFIHEIQTRVTLNLNSARTVYTNRIELLTKTLRAAAIRKSFTAPLETEVRGEFGQLLQILREQMGIDILTLIGLDGRVIYRAHNPAAFGDSLTSIPMIQKALAEQRTINGTIVIPEASLQNENAELAAQIRVPIIDRTSGQETGEFVGDGMAVAVAVPLFSPRSDLPIGVLFAASILNERFDLVDTIKDEVFHNQVYEAQDIGTATIFLHDIRISTNVKDAKGNRAVGTRLSSNVADVVLAKGKTWDDRAFVVNNWYISAYEPIRDTQDQIIGALYVGLLEKPFAHFQRIIIIFFSVMVAFTAIASLSLLSIIAHKIVGPIDTIVETCRRLMQGDLGARVPIRPSGEMGVLCSAIDHMAEAIEKRESEMQENAQKQIVQSEKLASIGRLAAGIAHEINNPLTGVLTFSHLLHQNDKIESAEKQDLEIIIRETTRVREIVRGLLDFARQSTPHKDWVDLNQILRQVTNLLKNQKEFRKIVFIEDLAEDLPRIWGDKNQLQQVFLNLALNACEAMPDSGTLTFTTSHNNLDVSATIADSGCGIKKEDLDKIFDPFFTTKPVGKGTGLGLSVTYGNIQQHGGTIKVESEEGKGTTFIVRLPLKPTNHDASPTSPGVISP